MKQGVWDVTVEGVPRKATVGHVLHAVLTKPNEILTLCCSYLLLVPRDLHSFPLNLRPFRPVSRHVPFEILNAKLLHSFISFVHELVSPIQRKEAKYNVKK